MYRERFPLTYAECRDRFRVAARGARHTAFPIEAPGPDGDRLTIDSARLGPESASRVLLVLAGVHGVEGFSSSVIMCDALERWTTTGLPDDAAVLLVHAVNPWGMAWWRRQNESNVDLNRNWARDERSPAPNPGYDVMHPILCPGGDRPPTPESMLEPAAALIREHGDGWVKAAVAEGQYTHPDGLYFGGERTEPSTRLLADVVERELAGTGHVVAVDLHTGHGDYGTVTLLTQTPVDSPGDHWAREHFGGFRIENSVATDATTPPKQGRLVSGLADIVPAATWRSVTMELGTADDTDMILAERSEHWVHLHGDRSDPTHAAIVRHHRDLSAPDDPAWEAAAAEHGHRVLDAALAALA